MREWLAGVVGENLAPIVSVILAAAVVILLVLLLVGLAKRIFAGGSGIGSRHRAPRLAVLDAIAVDQRRKLVLVRRDEAEHLILIGGSNDLVVEQSIFRGQVARRVPPGAPPARQEPDMGERPAGAPLPHRRTPPSPRAAETPEPAHHPIMRDEPILPEVPLAIQTARAGDPVMEPRRDAPPARPAIEPSMMLAPEPQRGAPSEPVRVPVPAPEPMPVPTPRAPEAAPIAVAPQRPVPLPPPPAMPAPPVSIAPAQPEPVRQVPAPPVLAPPARPIEAREVAFAPVAGPLAEDRPVSPAPMPREAAVASAVGFGSSEENSPKVDLQKPASPEPAPVPVMPAPRPNPVFPPVSSQNTQGGAPRSMATPTLANTPRVAPPVTPPSLSADEKASEPPPPAPAPISPAASPMSGLARSLWSPTPSVSFSPAPVRTEPTLTPTSPLAIEPSSSPPARDPSNWMSQNAEPMEPRGTEAPLAEGPAPLTVRSFASTIQSRRTTPLPPSMAPASPPTMEPRPAPTAAPVIDAPAQAKPPEAPPVAPRPPENPATSPTIADAPKAERNLTLEEEMERLLHDFSLDVSPDRR